ncbi:MAG: helix-hairpin-helix domain-containing protein [Piscirickettsiaceae bacterium]|nr:helix-hairpin-helix domain-containing protein [Piscirickettsiaceae bacterium]
MFKKLFLSVLMAMILSTGLAFASDKININTASKTELQMLKGIGDATADAIIKYREENGDFKTVDALINVKGIGNKKVEKLADKITVSNSE